MILRNLIYRRKEIETMSKKKEMNPPAQSAPQECLVRKLKELHWTVTTVESCTGGMVAASITSVAGSSAVLHQGFVTYCDEAKHDLVGVRKKTLRKYTAVSKETAREMAKGGRKKAKAQCAVSVTGYAGPPTGAEDETVGLVYIGCSIPGKTKVKKYHFQGDRNEIRQQACQAALSLLLSQIEP